MKQSSRNSKNIFWCFHDDLMRNTVPDDDLASNLVLDGDLTSDIVLDDDQDS